MKLLLDEMFSPEIARQLRARGNDVIAVLERAELVGMPDPEVFEVAQVEQRAVVTENAPDFLRLDRLYRQQAGDHYGLIITTDRQFPRRRQAIGALVSAPSRLLDSTSDRPEPRSLVQWLQ